MQQFLRLWEFLQKCDAFSKNVSQILQMQVESYRTFFSCWINVKNKSQWIEHANPKYFLVLIAQILQTCFCPNVFSLLLRSLASCSSLHLFCKTFARRLDHQTMVLTTWGNTFRDHMIPILYGPVCISIHLAECGCHQKSSSALIPEGQQLLVVPLYSVQLYLLWLIKGWCSRALWYRVCCNPW